MTMEPYRDYFEQTANVGWEDVAIVVKEGSLGILNNGRHESLSQHIQQTPHHDSNEVDDIKNPKETTSSNSVHCPQIPKAIPIGSSDDSCSSESSCDDGSILPTSNHTALSSPLMMKRDDDSLTNGMKTNLESSPLLIIPSSTTQMEDSTVGKSVKFSTVQVRDFDLVLGDHPYCDMYPLSLDWEYVQLFTTTIEDYELNHRRHVPNETKMVSPIVRKFRRSGRSNGTINIKARKLTVMERMSLLIEFTGLTSQQLFQQERKRQLSVQDEKLAMIHSSIKFL
jgi:hypothetical protein